MEYKYPEHEAINILCGQLIFEVQGLTGESDFIRGSSKEDMLKQIQLSINAIKRYYRKNGSK